MTPQRDPSGSDAQPSASIDSAPAASARAARVLLVAGGTGGHIYPALALGRELRRVAPGIDVRYCCGSRPGEMRIYESQSLQPWILPMSGRRPGVANTARFLLEYLRAVRLVRRHARRWRPDLVVGFGNYLSAAALPACLGLGARMALHEQNAHPGAANRWLSRLVCDRVMTGAPTEPGAFPPAKVVDVGNPVREDLLGPADRADARRRFGLPENGAVALCFGGSLGALGLNKLMISALEKIENSLGKSPQRADAPDTATLDAAERKTGEAAPNSSGNLVEGAQTGRHNDFEVKEFQAFLLWATGPQLYDEVSGWLDRVPRLKTRIRLFPYIDDMKAAYGAADLVISRAGASTLAEITAIGIPSVLVPLPTSAGDHQRVNARAIERAGAAWVIEQAADDGPARLAEILTALGSPEGDARLKQMGESARALGRPDAAAAMGRAVLELLGEKT